MSFWSFLGSMFLFDKLFGKHHHRGGVNTKPDYRDSYDVYDGGPYDCDCHGHDDCYDYGHDDYDYDSHEDYDYDSHDDYDYDDF